MGNFNDAAALLVRIQRGMIVGPRELRQLEGRAFYGRVVLGTPVDTGAAASNWRVGIGAADASFDLEKTSILSALKDGILAISMLKTAADLLITHSADYIVKLNQGSSQQAPAMFVELAAAEAAQIRDARAVRTLTKALPKGN